MVNNMKKYQINSKQFLMLVFVYLFANEIIRGIYAIKLKQDTWIANLMGLAGSIIIFYLYLFIYKNNKGANFKESIENILGKFFSKFVFLIYPLYFCFLSFLIIRDFMELSNTYLEPSIPYFILLFILLFTIYYNLRFGIENIVRFAELLFLILVFTSLLTYTTILLVNEIKFENILPILENGFRPLINPAFQMSYTTPFGETFALLITYQYVKDKEKKMKTPLLAILLGSIPFIIVTILNIVLIGAEDFGPTITPILYIANLLDVRNFIQRYDLIIIVFLGLNTFIKSCILLYTSQHLITSTFKIKKENFVNFFVCILTFIPVFFIAKDYLKLIRFREDIFIPYVNLTFEFIIPIFLVILSFIRKPKQKSKELETLSKI